MKTCFDFLHVKSWLHLRKTVFGSLPYKYRFCVTVIFLISEEEPQISLLQLRNASMPISSKEAGKLILSKFMQFWNEYGSIVCTEFSGMTMVIKFLQPKSAFCRTRLSVCGK